MAKAKKAAPASSKKALREKVATTLKKSFSDIEKAVGEKKFEDKIKKASKILAKGAGKNKKEIKAKAKDKTKTKAKSKVKSKLAAKD